MTAETSCPETSFTEVFTQALRGEPTDLVDLDGQALRPLPVADWTRAADAEDLDLLALCRGATIDIGCGPGRLTVALSRLGHHALGVDVVQEAVRLTRGGGGKALVADVFDMLPDEGRWQTALLADGNVGISGDPVRLLRRAAELIRPDGHVVVELAPPGTRSESGWAALQGAAGRSRPFRWAWVSVDDVRPVAHAAGLHLESTHALGRRWAAVLASGSS
ncbi:MAG: hypothetical protein AVDCRST_MAG36-402 [uncultured Nocardioidaceae bacterium]|uniref:Methyltransferase domain-containing protein n=1 Tax=uncultured Nocardioidaceae bacterium TaxID=253824 RepID=A0A6J4L9T5_9ACTN|nr:MAG: hypothetical protein AVDCRST_MAG36-402 [uncultured Nocardioidaceae bacterium]